MKAASVLTLSILAMSAPTFAQDFQGGRALSGGPDFDGEAEAAPAASWDGPVIVMPEEAKARYPLGEAPFYVRLMAYSMHLDFAARDGSAVLNQEAALLDSSADEVELIASILNEFTALKNDWWEGQLLEVCLPILRGQPTSNAAARAALAALDDNEEELDAMARGLVSSAVAKLPSNLAPQLESRINDYGRSVDYTKVDLIKGIEFTEGGDFQAHLVRSCESL